MVTILERRPFEHCRTACGQGVKRRERANKKTTGEGPSPVVFAARAPSAAPRSRQRVPQDSLRHGHGQLLLAEERQELGGKEFPFFLDNGGAKAPPIEGE